MKIHDRLNFLLLGTLWTLAIVLILDFWLNTAYNFNMFSGSHWALVSALQAEQQHISTGFYVAFIASILLEIVGLYLLFKPKFRKINLNPQRPIAPQVAQTQPNQKIESTPITQEQPTEQLAPETTTNSITEPMMQRPPRLHIQMPTQTNRPVTATSNKDTIAPTQKQPTPIARYTDETREIFEKNGFRVLTPKTISGIPLSLIALGANETLWVGANDISHEKMADIMLALKSVFTETLEDIEIDINAFIINPTDDDVVEAILDFKNPDELAAAIQNIPNEPESDDDAGNMDAFAGYIETVLTYLGNK